MQTPFKRRPNRPRARCHQPLHEDHQEADGRVLLGHGLVLALANVSGHRLSTMEVESALVSHPLVAEAAVVGFPHELKGEGICCFVIPKGEIPADEAKKELIKHVREQIGALATPDQVRFTTALPKTRSGKIMRRLLRDIAAGKESAGDTTTLEDFSVLAKLREDTEG